MKIKRDFLQFKGDIILKDCLIDILLDEVFENPYTLYYKQTFLRYRKVLELISIILTEEQYQTLLENIKYCRVDSDLYKFCDVLSTLKRFGHSKTNENDLINKIFSIGLLDEPTGDEAFDKWYDEKIAELRG